MDRLTPFCSDQLYFDFRSLSSNPRDHRLSLELVAVQREKIDGWLALLHRSGLEPVSIGIDDDWPGLNLLPAPQQRALSLSRRWSTFLLTTLVLVMGVTAWYLPLLKQQRILQALQNQVVILSSAVKDVELIKSEIENLRRSSRQLIEARSTTRPVVDILLELTNLLSDDTWLHHLQIKADEIVLTGETKSEAALLVRLERSPMFKQVSFDSPLARISGSLYTRFHLSALLQEDR
jgi:general secretion pathway protein L